MSNLKEGRRKKGKKKGSKKRKRKRKGKKVRSKWVPSIEMTTFSAILVSS